MSKILNKLKGLLVLAVCAVLLGIVPAGLAVPEEELLEGLFLQSQADFDGDEAGNTIDLSDDTADWLLHGAAIAFITADGEGNIVSIPSPEGGGHHEFQMQYANDLEGQEYAFSVDFKMAGGQDGIFIKGCEPIYRVNPAYQDFEMLFCSSTYYVQNGGQSVSWNGMGGSGFCVTARDENTLRIDVAVFEEDGIFVSHRNCAIPVDFDIKNEMNTYTFRDNNAGEVSCYINGELFATVEYSNVVTYPQDTDDTMQYEFYKNVTVKDAEGSELLSVENSRLSVRNVIALAERGSALEFDNIAVYTATEPEPTAEPTPEPTAEPTEPDVDPSEQAASPSQEASAPLTQTTDTGVQTSPAEEEDEPADYTLYIVLAVAAVVIIAGIVAFIVIKNKKKSV